MSTEATAIAEGSRSAGRGAARLVCGVVVLLVAGAPSGCEPTAATGMDAGADAGDAGDARSFPEPEVCEAVCDRVYNTCGFEFPEDDRMPYNRQSCYNDCLYGEFDGAESCLRDVACERRSVVACVRDDEIDEAIENPCDDEIQWPEAWSEYERRVLELTNQRRAEGAVCDGTEMEPVPPLEMDPRLRCAARRHSRDMARRDFFAHESPDGELPSDRAAAVDYPGQVGENIAAGRSSPEKTVEGWMNSPGHCRNIMRESYQQIGVGYVRDPGSGWNHLSTQLFGAGDTD